MAAPATPQDTYRAALDDRRLTFQRCADCGHAWLPPRTECPECWSADHQWQTAGGGATVVSWVVFHVAFDPRFKGRTPYNVALVDLDEGPRLITNIIGLPDGEDVIGRRVALRFDDDAEVGRTLPNFQLADRTGPPANEGRPHPGAKEEKNP